MLCLSVALWSSNPSRAKHGQCRWLGLAQVISHCLLTQADPTPTLEEW